MAQESLGYVKLEWTCPKCQSRNPGPEKVCLSCGAPQPQEVKFEQAESQQLLTDEKELAQAKAGPDIHCGFCGTRNPAGAEVCSQCGGDLREGARRETGRVVGAYQGGPAKQIACPNCNSANPETALKCAQCGAPLQRAAAPAPAAPALAAPSPAKMPAWMGWAIGALVIALCICAIAGFVYLATPKESQTAQVQSVRWETIVAVEALRPVTRQDWKDAIPGDAQLGACTERVHHVQDSPPAGANFNKVCGTPYTVDKGSGFAEVVQDCQFEVLLPYCSYTALEWQIVDRARLSGNDLAPAYANPQLAQDQRLGPKEANFTVVFQTSSQQYLYPVSTLQEFQRFQLDSEWILNINSFGQIVSVEPAR